MNQSQHILILGGGFGGAYCARDLESRVGPDVKITVLDQHNYLLFYPLLVEAGAGTIEPRHAVVPIRQFLKKTQFVMGNILSIDIKGQQVRYRVAGDGPEAVLEYDHLVIALGSEANIPPVPGLREYGFQMKSLADAIVLRDRMTHLLERASSTTDPKEREALLHFVVVGGNFTGVEVAGEFSHYIHGGLKHYPQLHRDELRFSLIDITDRILPAIDLDLAEYAVEKLKSRGITFVLNNSVKEIGPTWATLTDGKRMETHTVIWCAGISSHPALRGIGVPVDQRGYILCERDLRVKGFPNIWGIGDCAVKPGPDGKPYPPTAQHAVQQAMHLAKNISAALEGRPTAPCNITSRGSFTPLGGHSAVAKVYQLKLSGWPAWFLFRTYYLLKMPTWMRKARVGFDWFVALITSKDYVQLGLHTRKAATAEREKTPAVPLSR